MWYRLGMVASGTGSPKPGSALRVVVAGGGIAGAEALLALRALAGERVDLTLISPSSDLVYRPLAVAEPFGLGHAERYPLADLVAEAGAHLVEGSLAEVDEAAREVVLDDGSRVAFDALLVAVGAKAVAAVENATTWWPEGDPDMYRGLLRDVEEGYARRLVFAIPAGAVWPLPLYELALMTAHDASAMGMSPEITVVTPEAVPLGLFGAKAARALVDELKANGITLEAASLARVERAAPYSVVLQPSARRIDADRVVAIPEVVGPQIQGLPRTDRGFIPTDGEAKVRASQSVWAAGDGIAYPVKYGGLATQQADVAAAAIARLAGAAVEVEPLRPVLRGVLMTGTKPLPLGKAEGETRRSAPIWRPAGKVSGRYLSPYLEARDTGPVGDAPVASEGVEVEQALPGLDADAAGEFSALWQGEHGNDEFVRRLGANMREYSERLGDSEALLRREGGLGRSPDQ